MGCPVSWHALHAVESLHSLRYSHDPGGIVALCGNHHTARGNGEISADQVRERLAQLENQPRPAHWKFELHKSPKIRLGKTELSGVRRIIQIDGEDILYFDPPEESGGPPRLNARFYDSGNELAAEIINNEFICHAQNWDAKHEGNRYTIWKKSREIALELQLEAGIVNLRRLNMARNFARIAINETGRIVVETIGDDGAKLLIPNVSTRTNDSLHWVSVTEKVIHWFAEDYNKLLSDVDPSNLPTKEYDGMGYGQHHLTMVMPQLVQPDETGGFTPIENLPLLPVSVVQAGLCPVDFKSDSTWFRVESRQVGEASHITWPHTQALEWVKHSQRADRLAQSRDISHGDEILKHLDLAINCINREGGRIKDLGVLLRNKYVVLTDLGRSHEAAEALHDLQNRAPAFAQ